MHIIRDKQELPTTDWRTWGHEEDPKIFEENMKDLKCLSELNDEAYQKSQKIYVLIIKTDYAPRWQNFENYLIELHKKKDKEKDAYDLLSDDYRLKASFNSESAYHSNIAAFPSENLSMYFYDQLLFMNYIQYVYHHDYKIEKNIIDSQSLFDSDHENFYRDVTYVVENLKGLSY